MPKEPFRINVLDIASKQPGQVGNILLTRRLASAIRPEIDQIIAEQSLKNGFRIFEITFDGVQYTDHSFLERLIVTLQVDFIRKKNLFLYCSGMNGDVISMLRAAVIMFNHDMGSRLKRLAKESDYTGPEKIMVLINDRGHFRLIGELEPTLVKPLKRVVSSGSITARELAEHEDVTINNASIWLKRLYNYGLVLRDADTEYSSGRQHIYWIPKFGANTSLALSDTNK